MSNATSSHVALLRRFGVAKSLLESRPDAIKVLQGEYELPEPKDNRIYLEGVMTSDAAAARAMGIPAFGVADVRNMIAKIEGDMDIWLNSVGGEVPESSAIANELRERDGKNMTLVTGLAASAASFILLASDKVEMFATAELMIHSAHGMVIGTAEDMRSAAEGLDETNQAVAELYAEKSGLDLDEVRGLMAADTYMNAKNALEKGFVDGIREIIPPKTAKSEPKGVTQSATAKIIKIGREEWTK